MTVSRVRELLTLCVAACVFSSCARDPDGARFAPAAPTAAAILGGADRSADGMAPGQLSGLREREARRCLQWRCPSRVSAAELGRHFLRYGLGFRPPHFLAPSLCFWEQSPVVGTRDDGALDGWLRGLPFAPPSHRGLPEFGGGIYGTYLSANYVCRGVVVRHKKDEKKRVGGREECGSGSWEEREERGA